MIKEERLVYGTDKEKEFATFLENENIEFFYNEVDYKNVTPHDNMVYGDFIIYIDGLGINIDVKRSYKIFESSIDNFEGDFYILLPDNLKIEDGWVINKSTIKSYWKKMLQSNSGFIGKTFDSELGKNVRYINVNESLKKRRTVRYWIDHKFSLNF